jgi:hypothetical protein
VETDKFFSCKTTYYVKRQKISTIFLKKNSQNFFEKNLLFMVYSGRGKFMPLPLKSKILETAGSLVTDDIKMFPL